MKGQLPLHVKRQLPLCVKRQLPLHVKRQSPLCVKRQWPLHVKRQLTVDPWGGQMMIAAERTNNQLLHKKAMASVHEKAIVSGDPGGLTDN